MKAYKITYHMYPSKDITVEINAESEADAIAFAKQNRKDAFSVEEINTEDTMNTRKEDAK